MTDRPEDYRTLRSTEPADRWVQRALDEQHRDDQANPERNPRR